MSAIRGTTPDYILTLAGYDLTDMRVYVTIWQPGHKLTKTNDDLEITVEGSGQTLKSTIELTLSQQETLGLTVGQASIQVKMIDSDGHVDATEIEVIEVKKALLEKVIAYDATGSPA